MKKIKRVKGFVLNRKTGHPSYAYEQKYDKVNSVGFTHNKNDTSDVHRLNYNINPKDDSPCYVKTKIEKLRYNDYRYKKDYGGYRIHQSDSRFITGIISKDITSRSNKKRGN